MLYLSLATYATQCISVEQITQAGLAIGCDFHHVAFGLEQPPQGFLNCTIIFNNQDFFHSIHFKTIKTAGGDKRILAFPVTADRVPVPSSMLGRAKTKE